MPGGPDLNPLIDPDELLRVMETCAPTGNEARALQEHAAGGDVAVEAAEGL